MLVQVLRAMRREQIQEEAIATDDEMVVATKFINGQAGIPPPGFTDAGRCVPEYGTSNNRN